MESVVVTGSSGFIGASLCRELTEEGYDVRGVDKHPPLFEHPSVQTDIIDLTTSPDLPVADILIHLAAHSQVQPVVNKTRLATENIEMTRHVLSEASQNDAFVVNASSRDVYGAAIRPLENEVSLDSPNEYAASKVACEALANSYRHTHDLRVTSLRLSNVYGPMDANRRVIPTFIALANHGETLQVFGGEKVLDFVHVEDVCDAILATIRRQSITDGMTLNIGSGIGSSLTRVASIVAKQIEVCPGWKFGPDRIGDVDTYVTNLSNAVAILDFNPSVQLEEGLRQTIEWYQTRPGLLTEIVDL